MIFKLRANRSKFLNTNISPDVIEDTLGDYFLLDEAYWSEFWKPLQIAFHDDSDHSNVITPPDITIWATTNNLILNERAYNALREYLEPCGEWLPLLFEQKPYWLLHTTKKTSMNLVDLDQSKREVEAAGFINLERLVFKEEANAELVFTTEYSNYRNLYCSRDFRTMVEDNALQGLIFEDDLTSII